MSKAQIADLRSLKVRNYLRGMIGQDDPISMIRALDKIRKTASQKDYQLVIEILRDSAIFKGGEITSNFIKACPKLINEPVSETPENIIKIFNENRSRLLFLLAEYAKLLTEVSFGRYQNAMKIASELVGAEGVSCFLIRTLFFIRNHISHKPKDEFSVDEILENIRIDRASYLPKVIKELSNPRTDYLTITKKISRIKEMTPVGIISESFVDHVPRTHGQFLERLAANYAFSLIDAFLFLNSMSRTNIYFLEQQKDQDQRLSEAFNIISKIRLEQDSIYDRDSDSADTEFFKEAFLLIEMESVFNYKTIHGSLYNDRENSENERLPFERQLIGQYFKNLKKLSELTNCTDRRGINLEVYRPSMNSFLENSTALLYYVEQKSGDLNEEESSFVESMSFTKDIGLTTPIHYLNSMSENAQTEEFKLVIACLRSIKDNRIKAEHALRKSIQSVTTSLHDSNIISLLGYLYNISPAVTEHLIHICDEMFLSKLFDIIEIPNEAIWTRAKMLEWYGEKTDDHAFIERAKNLRIDVQINKEKGTIDDSRIYVDPLKYTQWLNDNVINNGLVLLDDIVGSGNTYSLSINWGNVDSGLSAGDQLGSILMNSYREFCNNKYFGIASYLGRRIRHGTFKGTGMKEVKELRTSTQYKKLFECDDFCSYFDLWLEKYEEMFDRLAKDYLHIKSSKKPDGIIACELGSSNKIKIANYMVKEIVDSYVRNDNSLEIPYIITDYCWRLVEEDLIAVRKNLMSIKSRWAVFRYSGKSSDNLKNKGLNEFCQELNTITADRFRTISSWFSKPSIASPSADMHLLFRAVVSEIKSYFPNFEPVIRFDQDELVITGGAYFVIYDALYIIIYNAAKYGDQKGRLFFEIKYDFETRSNRVEICIRSDIAKEDSIKKIEESVEYAASLNFEDAHLIEGRSGIKKLKRMEYDKCIHNVNFIYGDETLSVCFEFGVDY